MFRYLRSLAGHDADAEDALQEAFLAAWRGAAGFRGDGAARGWMLAIARHGLVRHRRRRAGEPPDFASLEDLGGEAGWGTETPADHLARLEDAERLGAALASLPPADREILVLRELEELPGEEVATMLGLSLPAMKSRLHRARLRLAAAVREAP